MTEELLTLRMTRECFEDLVALFKANSRLDWLGDGTSIELRLEEWKRGELSLTAAVTLGED